ncbi:hypothetical protein SDJN03_00938, partial [Cucurbita argyrosperma subsp. sororia]
MLNSSHHRRLSVKIHADRWGLSSDWLPSTVQLGSTVWRHPMGFAGLIVPAKDELHKKRTQPNQAVLGRMSQAGPLPGRASRWAPSWSGALDWQREGSAVSLFPVFLFSFPYLRNRRLFPLLSPFSILSDSHCP